jgi:O-antigen/teichoic acid export membrane protein
MAFQSFLNLIPQHAGTLVLAWMRSPEEVGFYKVAYQVASLIPFGLMAVNTAIAPTLAQLYAVRDKAKLCKVMLIASIMATIFALPLVLLFTLGGKRFLLSIFGRNFGLGTEPLLILTLGQFVFVALGPLLLFLVMTGREDKATLITGTTAALNVVMHLKTQALFYIIVSEKRHGTQ